MKEILLSVQNLTVKLETKEPAAVILDKISFDVPKSSVCSLVGGSGSGKTTAALSILQLLSPGLEIKEGRILFQDSDLLSLSVEEMRKIRGKEIAMVFQEPLTAFNPVFTIGNQIEEVLLCHASLKGPAVERRVGELLNTVGVDDPKRIAQNYPHQLSGGLRQRAMIAMAIAAEPKLLIADEPTSNLDVTLQAKIIELFKKLQKDLSLSILLISHDLGMVSHMSDEIVVMKEGKVVEKGSTQNIIHHPTQEYTQQLLKAL